MIFSASLRPLLPLAAGLVVGAVGAVLFLQSLPGGEGSPEQRAARLESELKHAQNRLAALEGATTQERNGSGIIGRFANAGNRRALADGTRRIAEDLRAGRPVSPEDIFRASQPLMRDLAPLFDRMRVRGQQQMIDSLAGELARKYHLTPQNQDLLKQWFQQRSEDEAKKWNALISRDGTRLEDVMRASQNVRLDDGLETFMPKILTGGQLTEFNAERLTQKAERVQQEADRQVERLDSVVTLDEAQRDQVFGIMARSSRDYDPAMGLQGAQGPISPAPVADRQSATLAVLRPEQRATYDTAQQTRREAAAKDMEAIGLALPENWSLMNDDSFR